MCTYVPFSSPRFGFVTFDDIPSAKKALGVHNNTDIDGRNIEIRFAEDRRGGGGGGGAPRGGGFRGGRGGRGRGGKEIISLLRSV